MDAKKPTSFLARHEFLIRRLHSLSGLVPVGAYMVVHLLTNASVLNGVSTYQQAVYQIHALGYVLPLVEWIFIFIPILFHAIFGVVIIRGGLPNTGAYPYAGNFRYTMQRATGMIAFLFIVWHVFHMHGWLHAEWWVNHVAQPLFGAQFKAYNAGSTAAAALQGSIIVPMLYAVGILACVYHLANGIWTMGITWGVWISPQAQQRANYACVAFGLGLAFVGLSALAGFARLDADAAAETENRMFQAKIDAEGLTEEQAAKYEHKRSLHGESEETGRQREQNVDPIEMLPSDAIP